MWLFGDLPPTAVWEAINELGGAAAAAAAASEEADAGSGGGGGDATYAPHVSPEDVAASLDAALALQFGFLARAALERSRPSALSRCCAALRPRAATSASAPADSGAPCRLRVIHLRPSGGADGRFYNQIVLSVPAGGRPAGAINDPVVVGPGCAPADARAHRELRAWLKEVRVRADDHVVLDWPALASMKLNDWSWMRARPYAASELAAAMRPYSADASLVLMAMPLPQGLAPSAPSAMAAPSPLDYAGNGGSPAAGATLPPDGYHEALCALTAGLPPTVLCKSGGVPVVTTEI